MEENVTTYYKVVCNIPRYVPQVSKPRQPPQAPVKKPEKKEIGVGEAYREYSKLVDQYIEKQIVNQ